MYSFLTKNIYSLSNIIFFSYRAIETFKHVLYLDPGFLRSNEIHLRLAVMYKVLEDYESSYKVTFYLNSYDLILSLV